VVDFDRHADDRHERERLRGGHHRPERLETAVEHGPLLEEIVAGVGGQPELGKEREDRLQSRRWRMPSIVWRPLKAGSATRTSGVATATRTRSWL
jgi:hypothetical protein